MLFAWMALIETKLFRVWEIKLPLRERRLSDEIAVLSDRLPELKILHITDTHFNGQDRMKLNFLERVLQHAGDLDFVFITGDIMDTPGGLTSCFRLAGMIEAKLGIYAVLGGHDFYRSGELLRKYIAIHKSRPIPSQCRKPNPVEKLRNGLRRRGVVVLEDENRILTLPGGNRIAIIGLQDAFFFHCDYDKAWDGVDGLPAIVIAHSPDVLPQAARRGADLAFFGHTHGGQVRLPVKGALITRSKVGTQRARGIFREDESIFTINQGMGASRGTHIRLCCRPEVTLMSIGGSELLQSYTRPAESPRSAIRTDLT